MNRRFTIFLILNVVFCAAISLSAGCGRATVKTPVDKVSGTVRLNDTIVNYGAVIFRDANGKEKKVTILSDGTYSITNPPSGQIKVLVKTGSPPIPAASPGGEDGKAPPSFKKIDLPAKYSDPEKTDLLFTVGSGDQTFDINMKSEPEKKEKEKEKKDDKKS